MWKYGTSLLTPRNVRAQNWSPITIIVDTIIKFFSIERNIGQPFLVVILKVTKRRILARLRDGGLHGYQLAKDVDMPVTGIYQHLRELEAEGLITYKRIDRRKVFFLTEKGTKLIDILEPKTKMSS